MWQESIYTKKEIKNKKSIEQQILEIQGRISENEAKVWLYKFLKENPTFLLDTIAGVELYPFQHILIKGMMESDYSMLVASRGIGKSFLTALAVIQIALFNPGWEIGVLANSFRQAKTILKKIEDISQKPEATLLRACIGDIRKANDEWTLKIGNAVIHCLPMGSGEKLRGFRFNALAIDEFLLFQESVFTDIIIPFLSIPYEPKKRSNIQKVEDELIEKGEMTEDERTEFTNNKLIILSSASYKFDYLYKLYDQWYKSMTDKEYTGNDKGIKKFIAQLSYDIAPKGLYDEKFVEQGRQNMSDSAFSREYGAQFTDDSSGYFKISKINECSHKPGTYPSIEVKGDPNAEYIISFDPSWAENDASDDFAIHVFKLDNEKKQGLLVHSYALHGKAMKDHIFYMKYLLTNFNVVFIVGDYNGGVQFLNAANESAEWKTSNINVGLINQDFNDKSKYLEELTSARNQYNKQNRTFCFLRTPNPTWIREANESLQNAFDKKKIWFASRAMDRNNEGCVSYTEQKGKNIPIDEISFNDGKENEEDFGDRDDKMAEFVDWVYSNLELTKNECSLIQVSSTSQGTQQFNLPPDLRRRSESPDRARKDSYSALVLGNYAINLYYDIMSKQQEKNDFIPFFM